MGQNRHFRDKISHLEQKVNVLLYLNIDKNLLYDYTGQAATATVGQFLGEL